MTRSLVAALSISALAFSPSALAARYNATDIRFDDVTGDVKVTTNSGSVIEVTIRQAKTHRPVTVQLVDGVVVVTGERWKEEEYRDCCNDRIRRYRDLRTTRAARADADRLGADFFADWPVIEVSMPRQGDATFKDARVKLAMGGLEGTLTLDACYVYGETGELGQAIVDVVAGSKLVMGDVKSMLELNMSGEADVLAGDAAMADIDIAGAGDVSVGAIDGMTDVSIAGSGTVRAARLDGPVTVRIAGSGAVLAQAGKADALKATIDGSGGVFLEGAAASPVLRLFGSSEVRLGSMTGRMTRHGDGEVYVAGKLIPRR